MEAAKPVIAFIWITSVIAAVVSPTPTVGMLGVGVAGSLAAAHIIECAIFFPRLRKAGGSLSSHLWQTFVYGYFHVAGLNKPAA